jgi:uncharacterized Zn-binding protein involved in type VI secretion
VSSEPAARVTDPFGHTMAMPGALAGMGIGAIIGIGLLTVATGGVGLVIAAGAAVALTGGLGLAGEAIGSTIPGPPTGAITIGSPNVITNSLPQAMAVIAMGPCAQEGGPPVPEATGAATVLVNGMPAGRVGEKMACSAIILSGSPNVVIGGPSVQVLPITPEVPQWLHTTMQVMAIGGAIIATGGIAAGYGLGAAVGSVVGGYFGGKYGSEGGVWAAQQLGFGATGQAVAGVAGGLLGGAIGGGAGFRGGQLAGNRFLPNPTSTGGVLARQGLSGGNPAAVAAVNRMPPAFRSEHAAARAAGWQRPDGKTWYPPNNGGVGTPVTRTLPEGMKLDRFGNEGGSFMSNAGDNFGARALPGQPAGPANPYTTGRGLVVEESRIAPWFDQPGGGTQYRLVNPNGSGNSLPVQEAIDLGSLTRGH